jgi:hypothetical protein
MVSSVAIYNRAWEMFEPAEPPHGAAKISFSNAPKLKADFDNLLIRFDDGRFALAALDYPEWNGRLDRWQQLWFMMVRPLPTMAPLKFVGGSNWADVAARQIDFRRPDQKSIFGYYDTIGIKDDGTLWISSKAEPQTWTGAEMKQFGDENNWRQLSGRGSSILLLKTDGTLWRWPMTNHDLAQWLTNWPTVRNSRLQQVGTNSDWIELYNHWPDYLKKKDGTVWMVNFSGTNEVQFERQTNVDGAEFKTFSFAGDVHSSFIATNGTLWIRNYDYGKSAAGGLSWIDRGGFLQVGTETNWISVAIMWNSMIAFKSDGTLWKWHLMQTMSAADIAKTAPAQLGIHRDWVALGGSFSGAISLAADGSLWFWPGDNFYDEALMKAPKQPKLLGNILTSVH